MTRPKTHDGELLGDIRPEQIYRTTLGEELFGYGHQSIRDKIKKGEIPTPSPLSQGSRFEAWTGAQILAHRAAMRELGEANAKDRRDRPKQEQPTALRGKVRKQKLRPPAPRKSGGAS